MKKLLPVILLLIPSMTYAAFVKTTGTVKMSGSIAINANYAFTPTNTLLDFEAGTSGDLVTAAYMNSMQKGVPITWTTSRTLQHTKVDSFNKALIQPAKIGTILYSGNGTRGLMWDLDLAVSNASSPIYELITGTPTTAASDVIVSGMSQFNETSPFAVDHIWINQPSYVVLQDTDDNVRVETQVSGVTTRGTNIPVQHNKWYYWSVRKNGIAGRVEAYLVDPDTNGLVGTSGVNTTDVIGNIANITLQDYLNFAGGNILDDNIMIDTTNHTYPNVPINLDFAPTYVHAFQQGVNNIDVTWANAKAASYKVERWSASSGWITLLNNFYPEDYGSFSYIDIAVVNGTQYQYRITSQIGSISCPSTLSNLITVNNSPSGTESTWQTQTGTSGTELSLDFEAHPNGMAQKIKGISGSPVNVSAIIFNMDFVSRTDPVRVSLYSNADGTGTWYGTSIATTTADGPNLYTFFVPAVVPANTDFWAVLENSWARVQFTTQPDFPSGYLPSQGYNLDHSGSNTVGGTVSDTTFTIKTKS